MRRLAAAITTTAISAVAIGTTFSGLSGTATAAAVFSLIDGNAAEGRVLYDTSDDGSFAITDSAEPFGGTGMKIVDLTTGGSIELPAFVGRDLYLSGDGRRVVFGTTAQLSPGDNDTSTDVYSMSIRQQADIRWISPGYAR
jgi:hypothetical protein